MLTVKSPRFTPKTGPRVRSGVSRPAFRNGCRFYLKKPDLVKAVVREEKGFRSLERYQSPSIFIMSTIWPRW